MQQLQCLMSAPKCMALGTRCLRSAGNSACEKLQGAEVPAWNHGALGQSLLSLGVQPSPDFEMIHRELAQDSTRQRVSVNLQQ